MPIHNFNGVFTNPDGTFPVNETIGTTLTTGFMVADGKIIMQSYTESPISDLDGSFQLPVIVPDYPEQAARYVFHLPDGQEFPGGVGQNSPTDFEVFMAIATDEDSYTPIIGSGDVYGPPSAIVGNFADFTDADGKHIGDSTFGPSSFDPAGSAAGVQTNLDTHKASGTVDHVGLLGKDAVIEVRMASFTLDTSHRGKIIECTGPFTVTIPLGLPDGFQCAFFNMQSDPITFISPGTLLGKGTILNSQYAMCLVYHKTTNLYRITGDIE